MPLFMPGDKVRYHGDKYSMELSSKVGVVVKTVSNEPNAVVCDFGDDVYICDVNNLRRAQVNSDWQLQKKRRISEED